MGVYESGVYGSDVYKSGVYSAGSEDTVTIGGRTYKTVKIGDQVWLAENLDYKFPGLTVGSWSTDPSAGYYNNDEETYGIDGSRKCGLLYNWYAVKYLEDHKSEYIPGWHVPTDDEWTALTNAAGANSGTKLKAKNNTVASGTWPTGWGGTDDYGFGVLPAGYCYDGSYSGVGSRGYFWSVSESSSSNAWRRYFDTSASVTRGNYTKTGGSSLRLVKDAPAALLGGSLLGSPNAEATDGE